MKEGRGGKKGGDSWRRGGDSWAESLSLSQMSYHYQNLLLAAVE